MHEQLLNSLKTSISSNVFPPSPEFMPNPYLIERCYYTSDYEVTLQNDEVIFSPTTLGWIDEVTLVVWDINCDIKLKLLLGSGEIRLIHPSKRTVEGPVVILTFTVKTIPLTIQGSINNDSKTCEIQKLSIVGYPVETIVDSMLTFKTLWDEIDKESLNSEIFLDSELTKKTNALSELRQESLRIQSTISELNESNEIAQTQLENTRDYLKSARQELDQVNKKVQEYIETAESAEDKVNETMEELHNINESKTKAEKEIRELTQELERFKKEASTYSEDFSTYKEEVSKQNKLFVFLIFVFVILGSFLTKEMYESALATVGNLQFNFDLWTLFVSRVPLVSINLLVLGAISTIIIFLLRIVTTNAKSVADTKRVTYLVKECVDAQTSNLDLTETQILNQRVESKMKLIRELIHAEKTDNIPPDNESKKVLNIILDKISNSK